MPTSDRHKQTYRLPSALAALIVLTIVAISWVALFSGTTVDALERSYLNIAIYSYGIMLLPSLATGGKAATAAAIAGGVLLIVLLGIDLTTLRFFDASFMRVLPYLPVNQTNWSPESLIAYVMSYVPIFVCAIAVVTVVAAFGVSLVTRNVTQSRMTIVAFALVAYATSAASGMIDHNVDPRIAKLMAEPPLAVNHSLASSGPASPLTLRDGEGLQPDTVIVIVMESTGALLRSSDGRSTLSDKIVADSGTSDWVRFDNAITVSNATDIAVPALLKGVGAHEPFAKLAAFPFPSQYADARGYRTAFVTSSTVQWAGFDDFLKHAGYDIMVTGDNSGLPFINDVAVDDAFAYRAASRIIDNAKGKLFLTLYPQSLHWPFQQHSAFDIPVEIQDRRSRATYVQEQGLRILFQALKQSQRLQDAAIVIVGDHGEFDYRGALRMSQMRLETFEGGILSPIF